MKVLKKAMALFLAMLMVLAVAPAAFAEEAVEEEIVVPDVEAPEDAATETVNPFAFIGMFFESLANILRSVVTFLENMFSGASGNDALEQLK